jgi:uncharacterized protein (TIGR03435 family)
MLNSIVLRLNSSERFRLTAGLFAGSVVLIIGILEAPPMGAQSESAPRPRFEVVSIKPCQPRAVPPGRGRGGAATPGDPGLLRFTCVPVDLLIRFAYLRYASAKPDPEAATLSQRVMNQKIDGEPSWAESERYTIDAKPETPQTISMMRGPMLQTLLEERSQLKIHQDYKEVSVYALVIGKGGAKLTASKEGGCALIDPAHPETAFGPGKPPPCGPFGPDTGGGIVTFGSTLANLCAQFSVALDRDVIDRTGLTGKFDIHLQLTQQELFPWEGAHETAAAATAPDPSDSTSAIMAAVQKLGLRLEPAKAPAQHLVIDHIERPSEN